MGEATRTETDDETILVTADDVHVEVDLVGPRVRRLSTGGVDYLGPSTATGSHLVGTADLAHPATTLVGAETEWRVVDHTGGNLTLAADPIDLDCRVIAAVSVGSFGLAMVHGITNTGSQPIGVGISARVHPAAGTGYVLALCGDASGDTADLVGADSAEVAGRAVDDLELTLVASGGRPLPGTTHVVHRLRSGPERDGDGLRIWGDAEFTWTTADIHSRAVQLDLQMHSPDGPQVLCDIAPGDTRMISWGLQPFALHGPTA